MSLVSNQPKICAGDTSGLSFHLLSCHLPPPTVISLNGTDSFLGIVPKACISSVLPPWVIHSSAMHFPHGLLWVLLPRAIWLPGSCYHRAGPMLVGTRARSRGAWHSGHHQHHHASSQVEEGSREEENGSGSRGIGAQNPDMQPRSPSIFSYVCWPSVCFLWKNVYSGRLPPF